MVRPYGQIVQCKLHGGTIINIDTIRVIACGRAIVDSETLNIRQRQAIALSVKDLVCALAQQNYFSRLQQINRSRKILKFFT